MGTKYWLFHYHGATIAVLSASSYLANMPQAGLLASSLFGLEFLLPLALSILLLEPLIELLGRYLPDARAGLLRILKTGGRQPASNTLRPISMAFFL